LIIASEYDPCPVSYKSDSSLLPNLNFILF
jgi:hypothetical protein